MKHLKFLLLVCTILLCTTATAQVTFDKDFATFLGAWATKAAQHADHANKMSYLFFFCGFLTCASVMLPFTDRKGIKVISFVLALGGAGITQYLGAFQVDPKMISKKAKIMTMMVSDFESKLKEADLSDPNIATQYMLEKRQLEVELKKLHRQVQGIDEEMPQRRSDLSSQPQFVRVALFQSLSACAQTTLNPRNGEFQINGKRTELPGSVVHRMKQDTINLYVVGGSYGADINDAIAQADSCIASSVKWILPGI